MKLTCYKKKWGYLISKNMIYLAHIWGAEVAAMGSLGEIMVRENPQLSFFINKAGVGVDL